MCDEKWLKIKKRNIYIEGIGIKCSELRWNDSLNEIKYHFFTLYIKVYNFIKSSNVYINK